MGASDVAKVRHVIGLVAAGAVLVFVVEPLVLSGTTPLINRLDHGDRINLYKQITTVTATLLGFLLTTVAILVALDPRRQIVDELKRGESFSLLVVNLLAAILFLSLLTGLGVLGAVFDDGRQGSAVFEQFYECMLLISAFEVALGGFFFALVTYKVASHH